MSLTLFYGKMLFDFLSPFIFNMQTNKDKIYETISRNQAKLDRTKKI